MAHIRVMEFKTVYKGDKGTDWVKIAPIGEAVERTQTWHRVEKLRPRADVDDSKRNSLTHTHMLEQWKVVGPALEAWKAGTEVPESGTPLAAWPGVSPEQAAILRKLGIVTVEHVRDMSESTVTKLPFPGARKLPGLAGDYLAGKDSADLQAQLQAANERMAAMEEMLAAKTDPEKRAPGRPKKTEAA